MRTITVIVMSAVVALGLARPARAGDRITQGKTLIVHFEIAQAASGSAEDPNLVLLDFASPITLSSNAVATATLIVDGVELGTSTAGPCPVCSSLAWEFSSASMPVVSAFPHPTLVDFAPLLAGTSGTIVLKVQAGYLDFGASSNVPQVDFRAVVSCGGDCTGFAASTIAPENVSFEISASHKNGAIH